jgi:hypothetical protein
MSCTLACPEWELAKPGRVQGRLPIVEYLESDHLALGERYTDFSASAARRTFDMSQTMSSA